MLKLLALITIILFAVISPGPDFAMVTRNSLLLSRRAGVLTALGIGCGVVVHVSYTILGVGVLIQHSPWLFNAIKLAGAAYLIYLGVKMIRAQPCAINADRQAPLSDLAALRSGFLTNVLNPKTTVFIVSLFVQIVSADTSLAMQLAVGAFIALAHIAWFSLVAVVFSTGRVRQRLLAVRHWVDRLFGLMLLLFGLLLMAANSSSH